MNQFRQLLLWILGFCALIIRHSAFIGAFRKPYAVTQRHNSKCASISDHTPTSLLAQSDGLNSAPKRVYHPKSRTGDIVEGTKVGKIAPRVPVAKNYNLALNTPQLLVRYRVPKLKSEAKLALESLQATFALQSTIVTDGISGHTGDSMHRQQTQQREYTGRTGNSPVSGSMKQSYSVTSWSPTSASNNVGTGKGISFRGKAASNKDAERRGSEGKQKFSDSSENSRWSKRAREEDDEDYSLVGLPERDGPFDAADGVLQNANIEGYFGDERLAGLKSLPHGVLATMDKELPSLEDVQLALYGEYGIKASVAAIRRRIDEEKSDGRRKRTGKTRREKAKARNSARNPAQEVPVYLPEQGVVSISDLAAQLEVSAGEVLRHLMVHEGLLLTINSSLDVNTARKAAEALGKTVATQRRPENSALTALSTTAVASASATSERPPVVAVMGHVDHGKTSLLDKIRSTRVALSEAGGITQALSAFQVQGNSSITFIDTPGHAAFRAMRERGARLTDIVVLVVAADDGVMEQTRECIAAAKAVGCPIVVAITKVDKEGADAESVQAQLMREGVVVEELGGDCQCCLVSSVSGEGIADLLEKISVQAEVMDLRTDLAAAVEGTVLEARKDKGFGTVVTAVLRAGTLTVGDIAVAGAAWGRVRRLISDKGLSVKTALPSIPVQIVGMNTFPSVGDALSVVSSEGDAQDVTAARARLSKLSLADLASSVVRSGAASMIAETGSSTVKKVVKVPVLIKCDVAGSMEAIVSALADLQHDTDIEVGRADLVYAAVGDVTSFDVSMAAAAGATVFAFGVSCAPGTEDEARSRGVDVCAHNVIYGVLDDIAARIKQKVAPHSTGNILGRLVVKKVFSIGKGGKVAGCVVGDGTVPSSCKVRVYRGLSSIPVFEGDMATLKVGKDAVKEVSVGTECGISVTGYSLFEDGDIIECFLPFK